MLESEQNYQQYLEQAENLHQRLVEQIKSLTSTDTALLETNLPTVSELAFLLSQDQHQQELADVTQKWIDKEDKDALMQVLTALLILVTMILIVFDQPGWALATLFTAGVILTKVIQNRYTFAQEEHFKHEYDPQSLAKEVEVVVARKSGQVVPLSVQSLLNRTFFGN